MQNIAIEHDYNQIPYPRLSYSQTHPNWLATIAFLLGMTPTPITECRVLEIGCAEGGNLLPMAYNLPNSQFVGLDISAGQIETGKKIIAALALNNTKLKQLDIAEVGPELGLFDYIIAHSVYSWVPVNVAPKVLQLCKQNLSPNGVVYINYNTYPGWHQLSLTREMMLYHIRHITDPNERVIQAKAFINFLHKNVEQNSPYALMLAEQNQYLTRESNLDAFLLHDELAKENNPVYFYQFAQQAQACGLQYMAEARFSTAFPTDFPPSVIEKLNTLANNTIQKEQYLDFLRNQSHRHSLLCHAEINLERTLTPSLVPNFYIASSATPVSNTPNLQSNTAEQFQAVDGKIITINHPVTKTALLFLKQIWPEAVPFTTLLATARAHLQKSTTFTPLAEEADAKLLATNLLQAYINSEYLVELYRYQPAPLTSIISKQPKVSQLAQIQAQHSDIVTNQYHSSVQLNPLVRYLMPLLDGTHTKDDLLNILITGPLATGNLNFEQNGELINSKQQQQQQLEYHLNQALQWLAHQALLV